MQPSIYTVIDANVNRLMEGLRVVEEVSRFILRNSDLTNMIKDLRAKVKEAVFLASKGDEKLLDSRDIKKDSGRKLYSEAEGKRPGLSSIITANIKRAQEAARVLEEFTKLMDPEAGKRFKAVRFELYDLEKEIKKYYRNTIEIPGKLDFDLYVVTDPDVLGGRSPVEAVRQVIKGGCRMVQLRDKKASIGQYYRWAKEISKICKNEGATFVVNDYADICMEVEADGLHIGQSDVPVSVARKLLGHGKIIGLSTHSKEQALKGSKSGADYISIGPIFSTPSKPNNITLGTDFIKWASRNVDVPFVAIGGINSNNLRQVINAGAKSVAVIRAAVGQKDIARSVRKLRRAFK